jgi:hypothetical protein
MKRHIYLLAFMLLASFTVQAQSNALAAFNLQQEDALKTGMLVLGGWAVVNILIGSFRLTNTTRASHYFYQMCIYWNVVNLLIAGISLHLIISEDATSLALAESVNLHSWYKKILYLNVGLDVGYMILGVYLKERSKGSFKIERYLGWGRAIVLQGLFLFLLDLVLVALLEYNSDKLFKLIPEL